MPRRNTKGRMPGAALIFSRSSFIQPILRISSKGPQKHLRQMVGTAQPVERGAGGPSTGGRAAGRDSLSVEDDPAKGRVGAWVDACKNGFSIATSKAKRGWP